MVNNILDLVESVNSSDGASWRKLNDRVYLNFQDTTAQLNGLY